MPAKAPFTNPAIDASLQLLGTRLREHRKQLGISATVAAEAAGMSRITWHRIEQGNPSVTMGAWMSAATVLGLELQVLGGTLSESTIVRLHRYSMRWMAFFCAAFRDWDSYSPATARQRSALSAAGVHPRGTRAVSWRACR